MERKGEGEGGEEREGGAFPLFLFYETTTGVFYVVQTLSWLKTARLCT